MRALSGSQPWWWAILHAEKRVENRTWPTDHRGLVAMHAARSWDNTGYRWMIHNLPGIDLPPKDAIPAGVFVGAFHLLDLCGESQGRDTVVCECGPWAQPRQYHWRIGDVVELPEHVPAKGRLGLWVAPSAVARAVEVVWGQR